MFAVFVLSAVAGHFLYGFLFENSTMQKQAQQKVAAPMVHFSMTDLDGNLRSTSEWSGKTIVLNFWATWCPPCQKETPLFVELQDEYEARDVQFIGVAIDVPDKVRDFTDTFGVAYPVLVGSDDAVAIAKQYGNNIGTLPYTVFINRDGFIADIKIGEVKRDFAEAVFKRILP
jgi:thiol-disulfide isomerase/thioredoxin